MGASADSLTAKMDALADALRVAGVDPDRVTRILGSAAAAAMHALVLDAVLDEQATRAATRASETAQHARADGATTVRLAA